MILIPLSEKNYGCVSLQEDESTSDKSPAHVEDEVMEAAEISADRIIIAAPADKDEGKFLNMVFILLFFVI